MIREMDLLPIPEATPESGEKAAEKAHRTVKESLEKAGITGDYLARKLKAELNGKETKIFLPKGSRKLVYSDPLIAWEVRQKARQDAHKLMGHYPAEKREHTFPQGIPVQVSEISQEDREALKAAQEAYVRKRFGPEKT